jgi:hypothetical protein
MRSRVMTDTDCATSRIDASVLVAVLARRATYPLVLPQGLSAWAVAVTFTSPSTIDACVASGTTRSTKPPSPAACACRSVPASSRSSASRTVRRPCTPWVRRPCTSAGGALMLMPASAAKAVSAAASGPAGTWNGRCAALAAAAPAWASAARGKAPPAARPAAMSTDSPVRDSGKSKGEGVRATLRMPGR